MEELILYTHPMSRGRVIRWALEEIGCAYQTELLEYGTTMKAPEYLNINPLGKVPALRHNGIVVTETSAICAYLADAFPEAQLAPSTNNPLRGEYYRWLFLVSGPLEAAIINQAMGITVSEEQKKMVGYGDVEEMLTVFEKKLSHNDYLLGKQFSAADISVCSQLFWGMHSNMIKPRDVFVRYCENLQSRPAAIRATKIDDDLLNQ